MLQDGFLPDGCKHAACLLHSSHTVRLSTQARVLASAALIGELHDPDILALPLGLTPTELSLAKLPYTTLRRRATCPSGGILFGGGSC
jgi:hypothetical protein